MQASASVRTPRGPVGISKSYRRFRALDLRSKSSQAVAENAYPSLEHIVPVSGENRPHVSGGSWRQDARWLVGCVCLL